MVYRQTNDFGASTPDAVDDVLGAFATIHGLAREGAGREEGTAKEPVAVRCDWACLHETWKL